jgi:murein L,D-transpeptidase YafK
MRIRGVGDVHCGGHFFSKARPGGSGRPSFARQIRRATMGFRRLAPIMVFGCLTLAACTQPQQSVTQLPRAERVVVHKAERKLLLIYHGKVERSYHVELGSNPIGQKERSGDSRTPEGTYRLEHNLHSDYFRSIKVSYPNQADLERARVHHWDPGGLIMIHGLPNVLKHEAQYYQTHDWTDGCIAVSNADMVEIWTLTRDGVPIDILP